MHAFTVVHQSIVAIMLTSLCLTAYAGDIHGNVSFFAGKAALDSGDWENVDSHRSVGMISDIRLQHWPVSIAIDGFISTDKNKNDADTVNDMTPNLDASTAALHLGIRKIWNDEKRNLHPYIGGGLAYINGSQERTIDNQKENQSDASVGSWVSTGLYWRPISRLNMGIDLRYSHANVTLFDQKIDAGGTQIGATIGYHW